MPALLNWLLRLLPTNPICIRLIQGGSRRVRHLYIRSGYLAVIIVVLLFVLMQSLGSGQMSTRALASSGASMFQLISYLQVGLICLLTPVFMAGAIAQEANPKTWDILLTTPLNSMQVVLGNLFGRLFFVLALLFSSLPLFVMTQYFGGVPGDSIFASYAIAGGSALIVAAIAVTLSVTRTAGRRAVFIFYISVIMYLFVTGGIDAYLRQLNPVTPAAQEFYTTVVTPLNPFLALEVLLKSNTYVPHDLTGTGAGWLKRLWLTRPIAAFCWLCVGISVFLILFSTVRLRVIGAKTGTVSWYQRLFRLSVKGAAERVARTVGNNPISWREASGRSRTLTAFISRWGFVALGVGVAIALVWLFHAGQMSIAELRLAVVSVMAGEVVIIVLVAINTSATAVSREREDGTLDLILTTPIQPGPYIAGKLRGLVQFLLPMMLVPVLTMVVLAIYMGTDGFGHGNVISTDINPRSQSTFRLPAILPEGALALPVMFIPFVAFCVMVGLHWSIRSKGTIGSVIAAVAVVLAVAGVLGMCAYPAGKNASWLGGALAGFSPVNLVYALVYPAQAIPSALETGGGGSGGVVGGRVSLVVGAFLAAVVYSALVYAMYVNMKNSFMMTVRKLAGAN